VCGTANHHRSNITLLTNLCEKTREDAFELLLQHAAEHGANAVIGMRYDATEVMQRVTEVLVGHGRPIDVVPVFLPLRRTRTFPTAILSDVNCAPANSSMPVSAWLAATSVLSPMKDRIQPRRRTGPQTDGSAVFERLAARRWRLPGEQFFVHLQIL